MISIIYTVSNTGEEISSSKTFSQSSTDKQITLILIRYQQNNTQHIAFNTSTDKQITRILICYWQNNTQHIVFNTLQIKTKPIFLTGKGRVEGGEAGGGRGET